jgi:hypothetical protein
VPDPTRPVAGAPIDTDWGQRVHDQVFTPQGTRVAGGASSSVGTTLAQLQLNTAVDDPGGWLSSDSLTVPTDEGGLYAAMLTATSQNGSSSGDFTRIVLRVNGTEAMRMQADSDGSQLVWMSATRLLDLAAGDVLNVWAQKSGGANPDVLVRALDVVRLGSAMGA